MDSRILGRAISASEQQQQQQRCGLQSRGFLTPLLHKEEEKREKRL
jgi:hypothetical protein